MISDFYDAVQNNKTKGGIQENDNDMGFIPNAAHWIVERKPMINTVKAEKLAASVREQNEPKPPRILTPQERVDLQAKAGNILAKMIDYNTPKESPRKADIELTIGEKRVVEMTNLNMLKN